MTTATPPESPDTAATHAFAPWRTGKLLPVLLVLAILLMLVMAALLVGPVKLSAAQVWQALTGSAGTGDPQIETVVWQLRLPRVLGALLVGGALAAAGTCYQALFRNPLVSPDILGVSSGAGLGAVAGIYLSLPETGVHLAAFAGGMLSVGAVLAVAAAVRGTDRVLTLVLTGVIIGALAGALTALFKTLADPYAQLPAMTFWLMGSLASLSLHDLLVPTVVVAGGLLALWLWRWRIDVLTTGDDSASALGLHTGRDRIVVIVAATLITASVTALAGLIGWVGLVIPHVARMWVGPATHRLLPAAFAIGAGYLLIVDTLARSLASVEIPIGILTALVGAPFFVVLLARKRLGWG